MAKGLKAVQVGDKVQIRAVDTDKLLTTVDSMEKADKFIRAMERMAKTVIQKSCRS